MAARAVRPPEPPQPPGLDLWASRRQTLQHSVDDAEVARLLAHQLKMAPHPEWRIPEDPTWLEDPFEDRNWCFQYHSLRWLEPLRRAAVKRNAPALEMWLHYMQDWTAKNPREGAASPWAWVDMADGLRATQLCLAAPLVWRRANAHLPWIEAAIRDHAEHLADPDHMGNANHALHQQEALFICGRVLKEERYWRLASQRMGSLLREQYDEQGMNAEGAPAYHHNNFIWWEKALRRFDLEQLPRPEGADRHLHAPEQIAHATRPDGTLVSIGDTDVLRPTKIDTPFTDYVTTDGAEGTAPSETVAVYDAGYVFARSGWGDAQRPYSAQTYYTLRFGPARRVHGHPDGTSLTYSARGVNWIVDPGKFQYGNSTPRHHFVSRAGHSVLSVEGRKAFRDAFTELSRHEIHEDHHDFLLEDLSVDRVELTRRVIYSTGGEYLVVIDEAAARKKITGVLRWQLGADVNAEASDHQVDLTAAGERAALWFDPAPLDLTTVRDQDDPFDGYVSVGWKKLAPATAVLVRRSGTRLRFVTVVAPGAGTAPEVRQLSEDGSPEITLEVSNGLARQRMMIDPESVTITDLPSPS
ncbi:hypothetical protein GCM10009592_13570 [Brachybacterium rhamnosum]|uniref:Heparinase II/III family protein n=1 Tax=Brachybacterium rhamnosum TaxID=173361 RepID=A0ABW4PW38_9MICO